MGFAGRIVDLTSHGVRMNPGPGSANVMIGFLNAWRALPASVGPALESLSSAVDSFMKKPMMTPADATPEIAQISVRLGELGAQAMAAGAPGSMGTAVSQIAMLNATNVTLTATWTTASAVPGGQPAANQAYTEGIKAAMASASSAVVASMAPLSDMHICPVPCPIPPHGPGFVTQGSSTVLINNLPATRQGDKIFEACSADDNILMGCPSVMIGE